MSVSELKRGETVGFITTYDETLCLICIDKPEQGDVPITAERAYNAEIYVVCDGCGRDLLPVVFRWAD